MSCWRESEAIFKGVDGFEAGGGAVKFRNEIALLFSSLPLSLAICLGILQVHGTTALNAITTKGVNSPHMRKTKAKMGMRFVSCQLRTKSWKSARVSAWDETAEEREDPCWRSMRVWTLREETKLW